MLDIVLVNTGKRNKECEYVCISLPFGPELPSAYIHVLTSNLTIRHKVAPYNKGGRRVTDE